MSRTKYSLIGVLIIFIVLLSCNKNVSESNQGNSEETMVKYATKFQINQNSVIVNEPWPGAVSPAIYPMDKSLERIVVTSTTHLPFLEMLGLEDRLVGFPSTRFISSPKVRRMVEEGKVLELGHDGNINLELLISLQPDAVIAFDMGNEATSLDKIKEVGIPVIYNADYLENTALGRAEWIKFFGALFNRQEAADSIFTTIETNYDSLTGLVENVNNRPTIFSGVMYGDTWFLPGGDNWSAQFFEDAGGNYLWSEDSIGGWLEVSFESVFNKARTADYWIGISTFNTMGELSGQDSRYTDFHAFKHNRVYTFNKRMGPFGGYEYFESGYARPDLVLADLIKILHSDKLPDYSTYYFQQVK